MSFTPLPDPPSRADPVNFNARADALFPALKTFVDEANQLIPGETAAGLAQFLATTGSNRGSSIVGFVAGGAGAVARTVESKQRESASIEDYGSSPDVQPDAAFTAVASAVRAQGGGAFRAGAFSYAASASFKLVGDFGDGVVYNGQRSRVTSPNVNTDGYLVGNEVGAVASSYFNKYTVRDITAVGQGTTGTAAGLHQKAAADINVSGGHFRNFNIGIRLDGALSSDFTGITVRNNGIGVKAEMFDGGASGLNSFAPNAISFYGLRCYHNNIGVQYLYNPAGAANWIGCNFEDNNSGGNDADGKKIVELTNAGHHNFIGCHFEANKGQYGIHYTGFDAGKSLLMVGCEVIDAVHTNLYMGIGRLTSIGSRITNTSSTRDIHLNTGARATLIDTEGALSGDMSAVACLRDGRLGFGVQPVNTSPLIDMQPDAIAASSNVAMSMRNDTVQVRFQNTAGTRVGYLQTSAASDHILNNDNAAGGWSVRAGNANRLYVGRGGSSSIEAGADNSITNGSASLRWSTVYAGTGSINTSDEREKVLIGDIPDEWLDAWAEVDWYRYKWREAVSTKGEQARWHIGLVAQRVAAVFAAHGLDAAELGLLCYDSWPAQPEARDEQGNVLQPAIHAGDRYGIRYEEALAMEAALQRRTTKRLAARLGQLEA